MEDSGKPEEASLLFSKAWSEATADFEKFIAAYYVARHQKNVSDKLKWFETSLQFALKVNDEAVKSAFPSLYLNIAKCYEALSDPDKVKKYVALSHSYKGTPSDPGPFFHGTRADLQVGELLVRGGERAHRDAPPRSPRRRGGGHLHRRQPAPGEIVEHGLLVGILEHAAHALTRGVAGDVGEGRHREGTGGHGSAEGSRGCSARPTHGPAAPPPRGGRAIASYK